MTEAEPKLRLTRSQLRVLGDKLESARDLIYEAEAVLPSGSHAAKELHALADDVADQLQELLTWRCLTCPEDA